MQRESLMQNACLLLMRDVQKSLMQNAYLICAFFLSPRIYPHTRCTVWWWWSVRLFCIVTVHLTHNILHAPIVRTVFFRCRTKTCAHAHADTIYLRLSKVGTMKRAKVETGDTRLFLIVCWCYVGLFTHSLIRSLHFSLHSLIRSLERWGASSPSWWIVKWGRKVTSLPQTVRRNISFGNKLLQGNSHVTGYNRRITFQ